MSEPALFPLESPIGFIIPRSPHSTSIGDASEWGGGAYCTELEYWFDLVWTPETRRRIKLKPSDPGYLHINCLEFLLMILQLIANVVRYQSLTPEQAHRFFPSGVPALPVLRCRTDNTSAMAWANRVTAKTPEAQRLVALYSQVLRLLTVGLNGDHIQGIVNHCADFISRPSQLLPLPPFYARAEQIFQRHPIMRTWHVFQPSPSLMSLLSSALSTEPWLEPPSLPQSLGQFVPITSTTLCSPLL